MRSRPVAAFAISVLGSVLGTIAPGHADDRIPGHRLDRPVDGAIIGVALGGVLGISLIPMRDPAPWKRELWEVDREVHDNFSRRAAHVSDALLAASIAAPIAYLTGTTIDDADGDRLLIYGQSLAINGLLAQTAKYAVQRPRPYTYSRTEVGQAYARSQGVDARRSFYSGHASLSFGAAVSGAYLLGASTDSGLARKVAWGAGLGVAATTSTLRVRAGKHFYSDVVIGAVVGVAVGYAVPALHAEDRPYVPSGQDVIIAAVGVAGGLVLGRLLPLEKAETELTRQRPSVLSRLQISPVPLPDGVGLSIGGAM